MAAVRISAVQKYFGSTHIIRGVDVDIADGEFCVLVGPSGCGKSTLLRMIAGLEEITGGTISIGGRVVNDVRPKERDVAMVFQNYALYPHMTVRDNMSFALMLAKTPKPDIEAKVGNAAGILGLGDLLDRYPRQLSGGQRQRVAMGRAIVRDPQVFLFDEPLSNLDAKLRGGRCSSAHERGGAGDPVGERAVYVVGRRRSRGNPGHGATARGSADRAGRGCGRAVRIDPVAGRGRSTRAGRDSDREAG